MYSRDRYICNFHISFNGTPDSKLVFTLSRLIFLYFSSVTAIQIKNMDYLSRRTFNRFENHIIVIICRFIKLHNFEHTVLHSVFKGFITKFALERFPKETLNFCSFVDKTFVVNPFFEAWGMYHAHATGAFTRTNQFIWCTIFIWSSFFFGT